MAVAEHSTHSTLVAGTAAGQLMLLDIERRSAAVQMLCTLPGLSQVPAPASHLIHTTDPYLMFACFLCQAKDTFTASTGLLSFGGRRVKRADQLRVFPRTGGVLALVQV